MAKLIRVNRIIAAAVVDENLSGKWTANRSLQNNRRWSRNYSWNGSPYEVFVE